MMRFCATVSVLRFREYEMVLLITLLILTGLLAGCQTVQGFGKDIEWTGQKGAEVLGGQ